MFWIGFEKRAMRIGAKSLNPLSSAGRMVGNKPSTGVAMAGAFKPNALPTGSAMAARKNMAARIPTSTETKLPAPLTNKSPMARSV